MKRGDFANKISTVKQLKGFCGRNTDNFHSMEITLEYFPQCGKYILNFPHC